MKKHSFFGLGKERSKQSGRFDTSGFDPETQYAVIRSSICTGEKVAGFKNKADGRFFEVMLIRSPQDVQAFKEQYGIDSVKTEY